MYRKSLLLAKTRAEVNSAHFSRTTLGKIRGLNTCRIYEEVPEERNRNFTNYIENLETE